MLDTAQASRACFVLLGHCAYVPYINQACSSLLWLDPLGRCPGLHAVAAGRPSSAAGSAGAASACTAQSKAAAAEPAADNGQPAATAMQPGALGQVHQQPEAAAAEPAADDEQQGTLLLPELIPSCHT